MKANIYYFQQNLLVFVEQMLFKKQSSQQYKIYNRMAITTQEEKQNRKFYVPIREGNRGGWSLFQWQSVREMPYRDRQMYLGNSAVIGVLDKGGKWRKRDWYLNKNRRYDDPNLTSEQQEAFRKDQQRMNIALGRTEIQDEQKLTESQMQALLKKIRGKDGEKGSLVQPIGLGFDKAKVQIRAKPSIKLEDTGRLAGYDQIQQLQNYEEEKVKQKKKKKDKKKKQKKEKHERSRSREKKHKKKRDKHQDDKQCELSHQKKKKKHHKDKSHRRQRSKQHRHRSRQRSESSN